MNDAPLQAGILVVDDHGIVREGLIALLERPGGFKVLGSAASGEDAVARAAELRPDVIIMDILLPDMSGIEVTKQILERFPLTRVIILSAYSTTEHVYQALRAGAHGYVVKDAVGADLLRAVKSVRDGKQFLSASVTPQPLYGADCYTAPKSPLERLSVRERDVLRQIVEGSSSAAIAENMLLSPKTIDTYRSRLMAKLGVCNRSALIRFAIENELTDS